MSYQSHYQQHLARFYTWMVGDFDSMVRTQMELFVTWGVAPSGSRIAFDLGSGPGYQSIALARLGFRPIAVDTSQELLNELGVHSPEIQTRCCDFRDLSFAPGVEPELIVCMGDTLTHLDSIDDVRAVTKESYRQLQSGGRLVLTFRDLSNARQELDRFFVVRSDARRILTCFLEDELDTVKVFDLLHEYDGKQWTLSKSCYRKLKLRAAYVSELLSDAGFSTHVETLANGMSAILGRKG